MAIPLRSEIGHVDARRTAAPVSDAESGRFWAAQRARPTAVVLPRSNEKRQRIEEAADRMACELLKMATDDNVADSVKLTAIRDSLDRAGLATRTAVSVEVGPPKPYEATLDTIEAGSRAEYRRSIGRPDDSNADHTRPLADRQRELPRCRGRADRRRDRRLPTAPKSSSASRRERKRRYILTHPIGPTKALDASKAALPR